MKFEVWILFTQFRPILPYAETLLMYANIVEQYDTAIAKLALPGLEIVAYSFVSMQTIDMQ